MRHRYRPNKLASETNDSESVGEVRRIDRAQSLSAASVGGQPGRDIPVLLSIMKRDRSSNRPMNISSSFEHEIRPATTADAKGVATVHVDTWREAYKDIVPREYLATLDVVTWADRWLQTLTAGTPRVLVAVVNDAVVGWIAYGPSRDDDLESRCAEIVTTAKPFVAVRPGSATLKERSRGRSVP